MSMQLAIFKYEDEDTHALSDLTTVEIDGNPWFIANEVCALLDIKNPRDAVSTLDDNEKLMSAIPTSGQMRQTNLVNESGLYSLIFRSQKSSAKKFQKWVTGVVLPSIRKTGGFGRQQSSMPVFVRRFMDNADRVQRGYFSVIGELFMRLHAKFEVAGHLIADQSPTGEELRPDVSAGRGFSAYLSANHPAIADNFTLYQHRYPNGQIVSARQYPNELLPLFIRYVENHWMPEKAPAYFKSRDRAALDYLPKLLE